MRLSSFTEAGYNNGHMENDENNGGLRSIERSNLSGAKNRTVARKKRVQPRVAEAPVRPKSGGRRRNGTIKRFIIFGTVLVGTILLLISTVFSSAKLDLTLANADVQIDGIFSAVREPAQSKDISYSKLGPFTETKNATITDITREVQNTYAEGTIIVFNANRSGEKLDLVNRTRFQTEDGRLYRLSGKQVIPGGRTVGGEFVPGRKEVTVVADKIGNGYNIEKKGERFSIPGLAKYKEFASSYAESKTKIVGGFSGERFIPDSKKEREMREELRKGMKKTVEEKLMEVLDTNTLSQKVVFSTGKFFTYESLENEQTDNGVIIQERVSLYAVSFRESDLAALLAESGTMPHDAPVTIDPTSVDAKNLVMDIIGADDFDIVSSTEFKFRLRGSARVFWSIDETLFKMDIEGKTKNEVNAVRLEQYPQIINIHKISRFPVWRSSLPGKGEKITVNIRYQDDTDEE